MANSPSAETTPNEPTPDAATLDAAAALDRVRHELANVALSIDALAAAVASGVTDDETVIRVLDGCRKRLNEIREWS